MRASTTGCDKLCSGHILPHSHYTIIKWLCEQAQPGAINYVVAIYYRLATIQAIKWLCEQTQPGARKMKSSHSHYINGYTDWQSGCAALIVTIYANKATTLTINGYITTIISNILCDIVIIQTITKWLYGHIVATSIDSTYIVTMRDKHSHSISIKVNM